MRKYATALLILTAFVISGPRPVRADYKLFDAIEEFGEKRFIKTTPSKLKAGPVRIHPRLTTGSIYDSNILLEDEDPHEDVLFKVRPGVVLEMPIDKHQLAVGYEADMEFFSKGQDKRQNDINQNAFALADFHFPSWYANVLEKFSETSSRSGTTFTDRIPRFDQFINPKAGYKWKRTTFEAGFFHFDRDFRRQVDDRFDFQLVGFDNVIYYDLFARLKALMDYQWAQLDYDDNFSRDGTINQIRVGVEGEVLPNLLVKARGGFQFRNYYVSSEHDFHNFVGLGEVQYKFRPNTRFKASVGREPIEATFQDVNYYVQSIVRLGFEYDLRENITLFTDGKFYRHRYAERAFIAPQSGFRRDNHVGAETGIRYRPRYWWEIELSYEFLNRTSNFAEFDYNDHRVSLSTTLSY